MGRYIQWDDVVSRYKKFGDIVDDTDAEANYISYAENYVDAGLGKAFTLPFSSNNATVRDLCIDTAFAKTQMFKDEKKAAAIMTHVNSYIGALASGSMVMVVGSGTTVAMTGEPVYSSTQGYTPIFGKGDTLDFVVDSSQLYDEEQARE